MKAVKLVLTGQRCQCADAVPDNQVGTTGCRQSIFMHCTAVLNVYLDYAQE